MKENKCDLKIINPNDIDLFDMLYETVWLECCKCAQSVRKIVEEIDAVCLAGSQGKIFYCSFVLDNVGNIHRNARKDE